MLKINIESMMDEFSNDQSFKSNEFIVFIEAFYNITSDFDVLSNDNYVTKLENLIKSKLKMNEISLETRKLFIETFDKLIENAMHPSNEKSCLKLWTYYLNILSNQSFYEETFMKSFKKESKSFEYIFKILKKIVDGNVKQEVTMVIIKLIEKYSLLFHNYS